MTLITFVQGEVRLTAELIAAAAADAPAANDTFGRTMAMLADPDRYPALAAAVSAGTFDDDPSAVDPGGVDTGASMEIILDGIEALIERSRGSRRGPGRPKALF